MVSTRGWFRFRQLNCLRAIRNRSQPTRQARVGQHAASGRRPPAFDKKISDGRRVASACINPLKQNAAPCRSRMVDLIGRIGPPDIRRMRTELLIIASAAFSGPACIARVQAPQVASSGATLDQHQIPARWQVAGAGALLAGKVSDCSLFCHGLSALPACRHRRWPRPNEARFGMIAAALPLRCPR